MTNVLRSREAVGQVLPGGMLDEPVRRAGALVGLVAVLGGLTVFRATTTVPSGAVALWVVCGVGVPLWLVALRPRRMVVVVALAAVVVPLGVRTANLAAGPGPQESAHDGGVHITWASADAVLSGTDPYTEDFTDDLPASWMVVQVVPGQATPNPVADHMPYLPAAFLVAVPGATLEQGVGIGGDPRWVMGLLVGAALVAVTRRPEPEWARAATILAFGSSFVIIYAAWGTNDAAAAAPVALALLPWAAWVLRRGGWEALRRWWTLAAVLVTTTLPFLLWSPSALVEDTLGFWTGQVDEAFPASGLGLGYRAPDVMAGPTGALLTVVPLLLAGAAALALVRRVDHPGVLPVASALVLLGLFVPARTFQPNYLALVTGLLATGWLVVGDRLGDRLPAGGDGDPAPTVT